MGVVFREPANLPDNFVCELLAEMPLAVYFTNNSPLVSLETVSFDDLSDKYLVCPTNPQLQTMFDGAVDTFRRNGLEPTTAFATMRTFIVSPTYLGMMKSSSETRCPIPKLSEDCMGVL